MYLDVYIKISINIGKDNITMKKLLCLLLAVMMLTSIKFTAHAAPSGIGVEPGQQMPDFTVSLTDGTTATLSEILKEKDLVVLNIFATWCGPCEMEFPDMEKVYKENSDRMTILSVSADPNDTMEMVADYKASHSLTFPMGLAGDGLNFLNVAAYPTTIFVTRDGTVGFIKVGAFIEEGDFEEKVNMFLSPDYDGSALPTEEARSYLPHIFAMIVGSIVLLVVGRWRLFAKAGTPGWYSLIPVLSTCKEFSLGWKSGFGILSILCQIGSVAVLFLTSHANWEILCSVVLLIAYLVIRLLESVKLAKAFGKGIGTGILLTFFQVLGRFGLSMTKSEYHRPPA